MGTAETRDVLGAMRRVRQTRQYRPEPVPGDLVRELLEVARWTGSSRNTQPWHFVVVTDRAQLQELAGVWRGAGHVAISAATIALVGADPQDDLHASWLQYDFGQATAYLMLAAADLGIGSGHAYVSDQVEARRVLGIPEHHICAYLIALGYPAHRPLRPIERPNRRTFDDVVHWDHW